MRARSLLVVLLCTGITAAAATTWNFSWTPGGAYPAGATYEFDCNGDNYPAIPIATTTQVSTCAGLQDGGMLSAKVRAWPPEGYQCGSPPAPCPNPSGYATLVGTVPMVQTGFCASRVEQTGGLSMAVTRTGSVGTFDSFANSGSTSISVPADAAIMVLGLTGYIGVVNGFSSSPPTIGGQPMTAVAAADASISYFQGSLFYKVNPPTGSQTLAWDWSASDDIVGGIYVYGFYLGINTSTPIRDSEGKQAGDTSNLASKTLTAQSGDAVFALKGTYYDSTTTFTWVNATKLADYHASGGFNLAVASAAETFPSGNLSITSQQSPGPDGGLMSVVLAAGSGGSASMVPPAPAQKLMHTLVR